MEPAFLDQQYDLNCLVFGVVFFSVFCSNSCFATGTKAGTCPELPVDGDRYVRQRDQCEDDFECDGVMKCCRTITGKVCMLPKDAGFCVSCRFSFFLTQLFNPSEGVQCPMPNTVWAMCASSCQPSCTSLGTQQHCSRPCSPGCICIPGYIRLYGHGSAPCVPTDQCPTQPRSPNTIIICSFR
ncbi:WAP domain containing protein, SLPI-like [Trichuris trichiura]|uniref:WAP domain containing protein, SLPI-like n=1 Tax=Trichuris trichiura TaxID=36087 RepID=A0A077Z646_TRITR|nr:WAP domain containing protein, SLPI-like [Trichuris trichiura]